MFLVVRELRVNLSDLLGDLSQISSIELGGVLHHNVVALERHGFGHSRLDLGAKSHVPLEGEGAHDFPLDFLQRSFKISLASRNSFFHPFLYRLLEIFVFIHGKVALVLEVKHVGVQGQSSFSYIDLGVEVAIGGQLLLEREHKLSEVQVSIDLYVFFFPRLVVRDLAVTHHFQSVYLHHNLSLVKEEVAIHGVPVCGLGLNAYAKAINSGVDVGEVNLFVLLSSDVA